MPDARSPALGWPAIAVGSVAAGWGSAADEEGTEDGAERVITTSLFVAGGVGMPLDLVQAQLLDRERVLDRAVTGGVVRRVVEVLMPGPERDPQHVALGPVDSLLPPAAVVPAR